MEGLGQDDESTSDKTTVVELDAADRRCVMLEAAVNAVMGALIRRTIVSAWKASGLHPLREHPPYTQEKADELKEQALAMGVVPGRKRRIMHLTGVLTDKEAIEDIEYLIAKKGKIKGKPVRQKKIVNTLLGPRTKYIETCASLVDVGNEEEVDEECEDGSTPTHSSCEAEEISEEVSVPPVRRRGRPRKQKVQFKLSAFANDR